MDRFPFYFLQLFNKVKRTPAIAVFMTSDSSALLIHELSHPELVDDLFRGVG